MTESVVVIGAGIVGALTAYCLAERGFNVTVLERNPAAALGTSRGNAGIVALGHAEAWGSPNIPKRLVSAVRGTNPALKITKPRDPALWRWGPRFLRESTPGRYRHNTNQLLRLCEHSIQQLKRIGDVERIEHYRLDRGALYLFGNQELFRRRVAGIRRDADAARLLETKTVAEVVAMDPALATIQDALAGAVFSRNDLSGDCHLFTRRLCEKLSSTGRVNFYYDVSVVGLDIQRGRVRAVQTTEENHSADQVVVAAGNGSTSLMKSMGVYLPIYPVKGYSMTFPITSAEGVPHFPGIDEDQLVSYARYGDRFRVTSVAEFAGEDASLVPERLAVIERFAKSLCGDALDYVASESWAGFRPATPASAPYIGRLEGYDNLWINAGHGQLGWSMSAGSASVLAANLAGEESPVQNVSARAKWLHAI